MSKRAFKALRLIEQHPFVARFVTITLSIIVLFVLFLFLPWQQTVKASGELIALKPTQRPYTVVAPIGGFVKEYKVQEGQEVKKGELLVVLRDLDPKRARHLKEQKKSVEAQLAALGQTLDNLQREINLNERIAQEQRKIFQKQNESLIQKEKALKQKLRALQERLEFVKRNYDRYRRLAQSGAVSQKVFERWRKEYMAAIADVKEIEAKIAINSNERAILQKKTAQKIDTLQAKIESLKMKRKERQASIEQVQKELARIKSEIGRYYRKIFAKEDGVVVRIFANDTNRYLKKGDLLLEFAPKYTKRVLRVKVSDFNMPLIREGLKARIIFYGWPAMQVSGWPKISKGTYGGEVIFSEPLARKDGSYYFLIAPDPDEDPWPDATKLKVGTKATVWVLLDIVPIWYELWRVMMALPPNMVQRSAQ